MTTTTRICGNASERLANERIEAHDVQAKNTAKAKRTAKVNRQSSFCRFSKCSKREEISACLLACCGERPAVSGARCLSSYMSLDGTPRTKSHPPEETYPIL